MLAAYITKLITARARKNKLTARMLANARKDHSIHLKNINQLNLKIRAAGIKLCAVDKIFQISVSNKKNTENLIEMIWLKQYCTMRHPTSHQYFLSIHTSFSLLVSYFVLNKYMNSFTNVARIVDERKNCNFYTTLTRKFTLLWTRNARSSIITRTP